MHKSAFISVALHIAILLWLLVVFPVGRGLDMPKIEDVPVDILTPSEFTKLKAGLADAKDDAPLAPKPQEPKPAEPVAAAPPPPAAAEKVEDASKADAKPEKSDTPPEPKSETVEKPKEPEPKKEEPKAADAKPA